MVLLAQFSVVNELLPLSDSVVKSFFPQLSVESEGGNVGNVVRLLFEQSNVFR